MADQIIFYGAPGTGKSFKAQELIGKLPEDQVYRTTIHPEYSYSDFIGQLLPDTDLKGNVIFNFVPGVFTLAISKAYEDFNKQIYLVLEEISRGNVAAIFGDIFQLLDRNTIGESEYDIVNKNIAECIKVVSGNKVKIPTNLNILCTVNTNDQNVFPMDTAFKRRFEWEYVSTKPAEDSSGKVKNKLNNFNLRLLDKDDKEFYINWISFYTVLNDYITNKEIGMGKKEDKQVGQFFIKIPDNVIANSYSTIPNDEEEARYYINRIIKNKLLFYLWQDVQGVSNVARGRKLFSEKVSTFDFLYDNYDKEHIFSEELLDLLVNYVPKYVY